MFKTFLLFGALLFAATTPIFGQPQIQSPANVAADEPILRLDGRPYFLSELTGYDQNRLNAALLAESKNVKTEALVLDPASMQALQAGKDTRARREEIYRKNARHFILYNIAGTLVAAAIFDNIVATHGLNVDNYLDVAAASDFETRYRKYLAFFNSNPVGDAAREKVLFDKAVKDTGFNLPFSAWQELRPLAGDNVTNKVISAFKTRNPDIVAKSHLAYFLTKDAVAKGIYRQQAVQIFRFNLGGAVSVELARFAGGASAAQQFADSVTDKDGVLSRRKVETIAKMLRQTPGRTQISYQTATGEEVEPEFGLPAIGHVYNTAPDSYRFFAWQAPPDQGEVPALFFQVYATNLVAREYMPVVEWGKMGAVDSSTLEASIGSAGFGVELKAPAVEKAPYPAAEFDEVYALRPDAAQFALLYAAAKTQQDQPAMQAALQKFKAATANVKTAAGAHFVAQTLKVTQ